MATPIAPIQSTNFAQSSIGKSAAAVSTQGTATPAPVAQATPAPRQSGSPAQLSAPPQNTTASTNSPPAQQVAASYQAAESAPKTSTQTISSPVDLTI